LALLKNTKLYIFVIMLYGTHNLAISQSVQSNDSDTYLYISDTDTTTLSDTAQYGTIKNVKDTNNSDTALIIQSNNFHKEPNYKLYKYSIQNSELKQNSKIKIKYIFGLGMIVAGAAYGTNMYKSFLFPNSDKNNWLNTYGVISAALILGGGILFLF
jgi:hypothetical protein